MSEAETSLTHYDSELGKITELDREYANDLADELDIDGLDASEMETIAQWFRKVRYEAVIEDRKKRAVMPNEETGA